MGLPRGPVPRTRIDLVAASRGHVDKTNPFRLFGAIYTLMKTHLNSGDLRYDPRLGNKVLLVQHFPTTVPRKSLSSVVGSNDEMSIIDFGPLGPKYRTKPPREVCGAEVKNSTNAEWSEFERRSREMKAQAPAQYRQSLRFGRERRS